MNCEFATVSMFSHAAVASLNNLEMMVYHYVIKNRDKVMYMTIRELAEAAGVSTTTVLRFCRKLQCCGCLTFKTRLPPDSENRTDCIEKPACTGRHHCIDLTVCHGKLYVCFLLRTKR